MWFFENETESLRIKRKLRVAEKKRGKVISVRENFNQFCFSGVLKIHTKFAKFVSQTRGEQIFCRQPSLLYT